MPDRVVTGRVDTLFNLSGVHVLEVAWCEGRGHLPDGLRLVVETSSTDFGCRGCGVIAETRGRRQRRLHDIPAFGAPVEVLWRQRRFRCAEPACTVGGFSEDLPLALPRGNITVRAVWWVISCIPSDNASVASMARRLGGLAHRLGGDQAAAGRARRRPRTARQSGHSRGG